MQAVYHILLILLYVLHTSADWCYTEDSCAPGSWGSLGSCSGLRQSPVDISTRFVQVNGSLGPLIFTNYSDKSALLALGNTGHTVEVSIGNGVTLSGGGLTSTYQAVAFHFHWGSEHRLNQKQFPMEMHVVHTKTGLSLAEAKNDSTGLAVLGVFIDVLDSANSSHLSRLSDLLEQISVPGTRISLNSSFSLDAILGDVNREEYYRYLGSLTTPTCEEAVVWTVLKNPLLVPARVIKAFTSNVHHNTSEGLELLTYNFRPPQPLGSRQVLVSAVSAPKLDASTTPAANVTSSSRTTAKGHIHARSDLCLLVATALLSLLRRSV
ncbi:carbonic anhydrase 4-like [Spea bombifrons]|uniref:carbonic anhydrase 4-like n=1 Tax=Spea bombifrons TaxID=233779 RepID=UPI002349D597|nr:carbonic anhydrase 4-like [Spea bombifrons]